ncbi:FAD-containing oxidoreductase [Sinorhizobium sp. 8-89]|uniref:FAD-containing oxidoreductase n=1 Tax=Sinorhizobium sp. 7-81 TaxID=3049087 RepID=UPI0024C2F7B6|nr:FAD-containing oxidoreductase [Sinorhizobium sp. 7-81]MDK1386477.1 FAD-containing oxidoreductase [Sinorhizobium sp. 7-81]
MQRYDAIFIGAGQAGPFLAARMAESGLNVALIEREFLGGTCVNTGCIPTKTLVASARTAHVARRADEFGVKIGKELTVDMTVVRDRAHAVTMKVRNGLIEWLGNLKGLTIIYGHAKFTAADTVVVNGEALAAPRIFVNVGARPIIPTFPGIKEIGYLTSTSILDLDTLPRHLAIIGGSYIGLEFAQMYRRFGSEVTLIERGPRLAPREDDDVSIAIRDILAGEGVAVHTDVSEITCSSKGEHILLNADGVSHDVSHVLMATGRRPNTDDLGLEAAGVELDARGYIPVNDRLETNVPGIWALGDCNGRGAFTHTSYNDFEIVAANLLDAEDRKVSSRVPAYALYIDPPLGRVGMTEREARASGRKILVSTRPMSRVARAMERGETLGFMKVMADADTKEILGATILGVEGDEAIHGFIDAMTARTPFTDLQWAVPVHPTVSELIPTLLRGLS